MARPILRRQTVHQIIPSILKEIDPATLLRRKVRLRKGTLSWEGGEYTFRRDRSVYLIGAGKGAARMAAALEEMLGEALMEGMVVTKYGYGASCRTTRVIEAGHPVPDSAGEEGGRAAIEIVRRAGRGDLVVGLWSGGGSALLPAPVPGISLSEKKRTTDLLLRSGATIQEINAVRKHLSQIKGGWLAKKAAPAAMVSFILSDVVEDRLDVVASGPTAPDPTRFSDAIEILQRYHLWTKVDTSIRETLEEGERGRREETPKSYDPRWRSVQNVLIGNGELAVKAASRRLAGIGYRPKVLTSSLVGEAKEAAKVWAALAKEARRKKRGGARPISLLAGGETTVTVRGGGRGGRCQEFALSAAIALSGTTGITVFAFSTDGSDGPTDAAGARCDGGTLRRAERKGLDARRFIDENNSYEFFSALGDLIRTGPTGTHLNDLYFALIE